MADRETWQPFIGSNNNTISTFIQVNQVVKDSRVTSSLADGCLIYTGIGSFVGTSTGTS